MFGNYKIKQLYIKLDKKLTLTAHNIVIPQSKAKPSFNNIDKTFDNIKYLFTFFDYIELNNIEFNDNRLSLFFADDILYISSNDYEIAGKIHKKDEKYIAEVSHLHLMKNDIYISGSLLYDSKSERLETKGAFNAYHIKGKFEANKEGDDIGFLLNSDSFTDLKTLIDTFPLHDTIKSWIVGKIVAKNYKLNFLKGEGKIVDNTFKLDFDTLKGDILYNEVEISYKKGLSPIKADNFLLSYKNGGIDFILKNPMYQDRNLTGSKVSIVNLVDKKPITLILDLKIKSVIDRVIQKILKAYALKIPVLQEGKLAKVDVLLKIPLGKTDKKLSTFVNVDLGKGYVYIDKVKLPVTKGNVQFKKGEILLKDVALRSDWYRGIVNGKVELKSKKADLVFHAKNISIGKDNKKFLVLKDKNLPFTLDYNKNIKVDIPSLKIKIENHTKALSIKVMKLKKIKPYLRNIGLEIEDGSLDIRTKDFKTYSYKGKINRKSCVLYGNKDVCYTQIPCRGKITKNDIDFYAFNNKLHYNSKKSRIKLKSLNIDLKKFLAVREKSRKFNNSKKLKNQKIVLLGKNSKIKYNKFTLLTDSYDIEVKKNGNIKAFGSLQGDIVKFNKKGKIFSLHSLRVKDKMLHPFINFKGLKKGRYTLKISGNPDKIMKGMIIVEGGIMSDFKAYNNTLALINTIPALATLQNPGFSKKGFKIEEGVVEYTLIKNKIIFTSIYIKGGSATIVGKGEVNIKSKKMKINLAIQTARELGKFVGSIPLIGYILMGKDKSMTVGLKIRGTLDKPIVKTSAAKEILVLPLELIKRTIESPAHILNQ